MSGIKVQTENDHIVLMLENDEGQAAYVALTKGAAFELVEGLVLACKDTRDTRNSAFNMQAWEPMSTTRH